MGWRCALTFVPQRVQKPSARPSGRLTLPPQLGQVAIFGITATSLDYLVIGYITTLFEVVQYKTGYGCAASSGIWVKARVSTNAVASPETIGSLPSHFSLRW
jgi:hypothetical protein